MARHKASRHGAQGARRLLVALAAACAALAWVAAWPATAGAGTRIVDVSARAGIFDVTRTWSAEPGHLNRDGWVDLLVVNHYQKPAYLYRGGPKGFTRVNPGRGTFRRRDRHDCAFGDVDRDRRADIYCTIGGDRGRGLNPNELYMQRRDGTFVNRARKYGVADRQGRGRDTVFLDANRDGFLDLYVGNKFPRKDGRNSRNKLFLNVRGKRFRPTRAGRLNNAIGGRTVQAVDFNRDRFEDLLVCGERRAYLFRNLHGGRFRDVSRRAGVGGSCQAALMTKLNGDRRPDLVLLRENRLRVMLQKGRGRFGGSPAYERRLGDAAAVASGKVDGNSRSDLYVVEQGSPGDDRPDLLLINRNRGRDFRAISMPQTRRGRGDFVESLDYDRNRRTDFVVLNGDHDNRGPVRLLATKR